MARKGGKRSGLVNSGPVDLYIQFDDIDAEQYARDASGRKEFYQDLAKRIADGDELLPIDRYCAALAIVRYAASIPDRLRRKKAGRPRKVDPGRLAVKFALLTERDGIAPLDAHLQLAEELGMSPSGVERALRKYGEIARKMLELDRRN